MRITRQAISPRLAIRTLSNRRVRGDGHQGFACQAGRALVEERARPSWPSGETRRRGDQAPRCRRRGVRRRRLVPRDAACTSGSWRSARGDRAGLACSRSTCCCTAAVERGVQSSATTWCSRPMRCASCGVEESRRWRTSAAPGARRSRRSRRARSPPAAGRACASVRPNFASARGDGDVAAGDQADAAAEGRAVDAGDGRLGQFVQRAHQPGQARASRRGCRPRWRRPCRASS